jgi:glycogen debranching enzyme
MLIDANRFRMFPETLVAYMGHAIALTGVHGHIGRGIEGLYLHQTRFVSRFELKVNGRVPRFVSANPVDTYSFISYYLAPSPAGEAAGPGGRDPRERAGEIVDKGVEIQLNRFVGEGFHHDVLVTNHALAETTIELGFRVEADFADITECVEGRRTQRAPVDVDWEPVAVGAQLTFRYRHPSLNHGTRVRFHALQGGPEYRDGQVIYRLTLPPRETQRFCVDVLPIHQGRAFEPIHGCDAFRSAASPQDLARERWVANMATLDTPVAFVQTAWDRAVADLASLSLFDGEGDEIYTPAAGIPLYQALFGRDTLTAAWQASLLDSYQLRGTIDTIAQHLGTRYDDAHDEQPGRVIHQHQLSPLSLLGQNPYLRYYGDYAGPGMFLIAIAWQFALSGDRDYLRRMRDPIRRVLAWMDKDGDRDGDGFYEYDTRAGEWGTKNQGWKDSGQAMLYPDGRMVENPIAACEIQGYYYAAKQMMGLCFLIQGEIALGTELLQQAQDLKRRFNQAFWLPEHGTFALALDPDKRPVASIASNAGHCLACGIVDADKAASVAGRLMAPDMFSGWGIRTLSADHPAFNPFAYHLGSVWPSENASIALGFKRYGLDGLANDLARGLFEATGLFDGNRLPEVIGGHQRDRLHPHPGIYPHACAPQAWSASAVVLLTQVLIGAVPMAPLKTLMIDPCLPEWLPELTLSRLHVGNARVTIRFHRDSAGRTRYDVIDNPSRLRVLRMAPPDDLHTGPFGRLGQLLGGLLPF